jgi:cytochrome b
MSGHNPLEAAMFWVGALLASLPVLVLSGVFFYVRWQKKKAAEASHPADLPK